jgi:hypothetical protein
MSNYSEVVDTLDSHLHVVLEGIEKKKQPSQPKLESPKEAVH